jgi:hypothetical protein
MQIDSDAAASENRPGEIVHQPALKGEQPDD